MLLKNLRDWCDGKPDCIMGDVAATRTVWAPFVDEWCERMPQNFKPVLEPSPSRGHLGWCNSNKLWTTYWAELKKEPAEAWFPAFGSYMPWAAATGSMEYFRTMPDIFWPLMRLRFEELDLIVDPDAILWFEQQFNEEANLEVRAAQIARWERLGWMGNQHRVLGQARSDATHGIAEYLALSAKAIQVYDLDQNIRARIAGHLLMGSTPDAAKPGLVQAMQGYMGHWGIDLRIVALCSGYAHHGVLNSRH